jgi:hypothetical protein
MENMFKARVSSLPQKVDLPFHESNGKNLGMSPKPALSIDKIKRLWVSFRELIFLLALPNGFFIIFNFAKICSPFCLAGRQ